jgi:hypothetical protein
MTDGGRNFIAGASSPSNVSDHAGEFGERPQAARHGDGFRKSSTHPASYELNPENPNRNNGPEHGKRGNRPARDVNPTIRLGPVYHRIVPVSHDSLLGIASAG